MSKIEYLIPEHFVLMGQLAGPMALKLSRRLHETPDCCLINAYHGSNYIGFINDKLNDMKRLVPPLADTVNCLGCCVIEEDVEPALNDVQGALENILDSMDEVKCSPWVGMAEGKRLLLNLMGRAVQDTITQLQTLSQIVSNPELSEGRSVIDLTVTYRVDEEMAAFETWWKRYRRANWFGLGKLGPVLACLGLGWLLFGGDDK